jgi:hypothetical protein
MKKMDISKKDLEIIWNWLKPRITAEDEKELAERWPVIWGQRLKLGPEEWEKRWARKTYQLGERIIDVLNVKTGNKARLTWTWRLVKSDLITLAEMLNLRLPRKATNKEILTLILQKIKEQK